MVPLLGLIVSTLSVFLLFSFSFLPGVYRWGGSSWFWVSGGALFPLGVIALYVDLFPYREQSIEREFLVLFEEGVRAEVLGESAFWEGVKVDGLRQGTDNDGLTIGEQGG